MENNNLGELIARRIGVRIGVERAALVEPLVSARLESLGLSNEAEYVALLSEVPLHSDELSRLVSVVTNPFTFFFRDGAQFDAMRDVVQQHGGPLDVWSAGCATGEEPYSLAMMFADLGISARILATDINQDVLLFAEEGRYRQWSLRQLPPHYRERYFDRKGESFSVIDSIRRQVTFRSNNLVEDAFPSPGGRERWDWILCRNVLVYFDRATVERVTLHFSQSLQHDGWLFLSTTENLHGLRTPFHLVQHQESFAYRLVHEGVAAATLPAEPTMPYERFPSGSLWAAVGTPEPALRAVEPSVPTGPPRDRPTYHRAVELLDDGKAVAARAMLERVVGDDPHNVVAGTTLGNLCLLSHDFEEAIEVYQIAQVRDPLRAELHYLQGLVYRKLGDLERAARCLRHALFLQPRFWCASFMLAGVNERLGKRAVSRRNISHTLSILDTRPPDLFASYVKGMPDVDLDRAQVMDYCKQALARLDRASTRVDIDGA